jgi:hypothetical protein
MSKPNPGPWVAMGQDVFDARGDIVAEVMGAEDEGELCANANLVAAAPDMLAALKLIWSKIKIEDPETGRAVAVAIAKAEGRA